MKDINAYLVNLITQMVEKETTAALFKATVILGTALLLMIKDGAPLLKTEEDAAYSKKFNIEAIANKPIDELDCSTLEHNIVECREAKWKVNIYGQLTELYSKTIGIMLFCFEASAVLAIVSFVCRPLLSSNKVSEDKMEHY
jgi:hypothetical protein